MARQVLIIHGWSDTSKSFHALADFLKSNGYDAVSLWLADYISMDDDVRVADVGRRMAEVVDAMLAQGQLTAPFDVIVHSTGGLVAREWLTTRYRDDPSQCPMKRLIMLAPANYGSKLAATGKSMLGRIVKGYGNWFQTGQSMLNDLELASPYQWQLVQRDVLVFPGSDKTVYYGQDAVWPFVIVGTHPYASLLRQVVNENGADGTVRVCAANLFARGVTIDFTQPQIGVRPWESRIEAGAVPLAVLPTRTHGSIVDPLRADSDNNESIPETTAQKDKLGELILEALACNTFADYRDIIGKWDELSEETAAMHNNPPQGESADIYHQYMQLNAFVHDDQGEPVDDYFLEFFSKTDHQNDNANVYLHTRVIEDVKKNSLNSAMRNLYFDRTDLVENYYAMLPAGEPPTVFMSMSAASPGKNINYFAQEQVGATQDLPVHLLNDQTSRWLRRNTTHFAQIIIPRIPNRNVFTLTRYA